MTTAIVGLDRRIAYDVIVMDEPEEQIRNT